MKSKILFVALVGALIFFSLDKGALVSSYIVNLNSRIVAAYDDAVKFVKDTVNEHFRQSEEIKQLRAQNAELEKSAALLSSFAKELNEILLDKNSTAYEPRVQLVRALSYVNISDYDKVWLDKFDGYDESKIYGLIYQGKSAGIVVNKDGNPLALIQNYPKIILYVSI